MAFRAWWNRINGNARRIDGRWKKYILAGPKNYLTGLALYLAYWGIVLLLPGAILFSVSPWATLLLALPWVMFQEAFIWPVFVTRILKL